MELLPHLARFVRHLSLRSRRSFQMSMSSVQSLEFHRCRCPLFEVSTSIADVRLLTAQMAYFHTRTTAGFAQSNDAASSRSDKLQHVSVSMWEVKSTLNPDINPTTPSACCTIGSCTSRCYITLVETKHRSSMRGSSCSSSLSQEDSSIATETSTVVGIIGPEREADPTVDGCTSHQSTWRWCLHFRTRCCRIPDVPQNLSLLHSLFFKSSSGAADPRFRLSLSSAIQTPWAAPVSLDFDGS